MSRARTRRPGSRGVTNSGRRAATEAAEAALEDLLTQLPAARLDDEEPPTRARPPSNRAPSAILMEEDDDEMMTRSVARSDDSAARRAGNKPEPRRTDDTSARTARKQRLPPPPPAGANLPLRAPPTGASPVVPDPERRERDGDRPGSTVDGGETIEGTTERAGGQATIDMAERAHGALTRRGQSVPLDDDQLIEERVVHELPPLRFAVCEDAAHVPSAQGAIVAAGHVVAIGGNARDRTVRVHEAIRSGTIDVVLVTLPGGEPIIEAALALEPRRPVVIASVASGAVDSVQRAIAAGADLATTRPHDVERLAPILLAASRLHALSRLAMTARGSEQILRARLEELSDPDPRGLLPQEMFQRVLELEIKRAKRFEYALSVALFAVEVAPPQPPPGIRGILRARAGNALINAIRDIDLATQLDHERFLVLLPYTDLKGAANVARRVIAAVASGDPVVAVGRSFPPRVVGAVAGAKRGEPVSFAKLVKDASRALDQARRDGAELAVQP